MNPREACRIEELNDSGIVVKKIKEFPDLDSEKDGGRRMSGFPLGGDSAGMVIGERLSFKEITHCLVEKLRL